VRFQSVISVILIVIGFVSDFISGSFIFAPTATVTISDIDGETEPLKVYITLEKAVTMIETITVISLNGKMVINTITLTITKTFYKADRNVNVSCIVFKTNKDVYGISEEVVIVLENNCDYTLVLPNSAPWKLFDSNLKEVFKPIALQVISEIRPGSNRVWLWDQKDYNGARVLPRIYYIFLEH